MKPIRRAGLVINPHAGQGIQASAAAARQAITSLGWTNLLTGRGTAGEDALLGLPVRMEALDIEGVTGRAYTQALIHRLIEAGVDALMVVGGDGTLADAAGAMLQAGGAPPIFGLGTGSTNAGALVTARAGDLGDLCMERIFVRDVPALLAYHAGQLAGVGFNDCVLGFTVVATIDGQLRDVAVREKLAGHSVPGRPAPIGADQTRVWACGPAGETLISQGPQVAMVMVGLAEPAFTAKALAGGACLASFTGVPAGCLVSDYPLVQVELRREEVLALAPVHTTYISLAASMRVRVQGCKAGAALCVDGNPLCLLDEADVVEFSVLESALRVYQLNEGLREG